MCVLINAEIKAAFVNMFMQLIEKLKKIPHAGKNYLLALWCLLRKNRLLLLKLTWWIKVNKTVYADQSDNDRGERQWLIKGIRSASKLVIRKLGFSLLSAWSTLGSHTFLRRESPLPYCLHSLPQCRFWWLKPWTSSPGILKKKKK